MVTFISQVVCVVGKQKCFGKVKGGKGKHIYNGGVAKKDGRYTIYWGLVCEKTQKQLAIK